jgi:hypothetical protein
MANRVDSSSKLPAAFETVGVNPVTVIRAPMPLIPFSQAGVVTSIAPLETRKITLIRELEGSYPEAWALQKKLTGYFQVFGKDRNIYEGELKDGLRDGQGYTFDPYKRLLHAGGYKKDLLDGLGTMYWPHNGGMHYRGEWKEGYLHGNVEYGSFRGPDIWYCKFENGELIAQSDFPFSDK